MVNVRNKILIGKIVLFFKLLSIEILPNLFIKRNIWTFVSYSKCIVTVYGILQDNSLRWHLDKR